VKKVTKLVVVLILFTLSAPLAKAASFNDIDSSYRFYDEVMYLANHDIIGGYKNGDFGPYDTVTREAAAAMIGRALGFNEERKDTIFPDVTERSYASGYINEAVREGIISGFPDGTYRPNAPVTRGQMAIFLARAYDLKEEHPTQFSDVRFSMVAYPYIKKILADGITSGYPDGTFRPDNKLTRGDFSAFLARAIEDRFKVPVPDPNPFGDDMKVNFINVGQGDSILIITPNNKTILVDGGKRSEGDTVLSYLEKKGVTSLDLVVATHPDADHIGGLIDVLQQVEVKKVLDSGKSHTSETYLDYLSVIDEKDIPFRVAKTGEFLNLDPEAKIQVLNSGEGYSDNNDASIVLKVSHGEIDYLLTGDAGIEAEKNMIAANYDLEAEVLKVGHHGSDTSTSQAFVEAVNPVYGILSYGEGNSYGHPHDKVYNRLADNGVIISATAQGGTIEMSDDGGYIYSGQEPNPTPEPPKGIYISNVNLFWESVSIVNGSNETIDISGWYLISEEGNQRYDFVEGSIIAPRKEIVVLSGPDAVHNPPHNQLWTHSYIWNNSGDAALLYNDQGELVSEVR
jgi:competence protein ComEC